MGLSDWEVSLDTRRAGLLPLLNLVALLDSVTLGFWTLNSDPLDSLWTSNPPNLFFPKQKGSWSLFRRGCLNPCN